MIGANKPRMLSIALPHVDAWNTWFTHYGNTADGLRRAQRVRVGRAERAGRDPTEIERSACVLVEVEPGARRAAPRRCRRSRPRTLRRTCARSSRRARTRRSSSSIRSRSRRSARSAQCSADEVALRLCVPRLSSAWRAARLRFSDAYSSATSGWRRRWSRKSRWSACGALPATTTYRWCGSVPGGHRNASRPRIPLSP